LKSTVLILAILVSLCADESHAQGCARVKGRQSIFRTVGVIRGQVHLGAPLPPAVATVSPGDTVVPLPAGTFTGADSLTIHLTLAGNVRALTFVYAPAADFAALVADYQKTLGHGPVAVGDGPESHSVRYCWQDKQTYFAIEQQTRFGQTSIRSILLDRKGRPSTRSG
jgi:hypothetical protein